MDNPTLEDRRRGDASSYTEIKALLSKLDYRVEGGLYALCQHVSGTLLLNYYKHTAVRFER